MAFYVEKLTFKWKKSWKKKILSHPTVTILCIRLTEAKRVKIFSTFILSSRASSVLLVLLLRVTDSLSLSLFHCRGYHLEKSSSVIIICLFLSSQHLPLPLFFSSFLLLMYTRECAGSAVAAVSTVQVDFVSQITFWLLCETLSLTLRGDTSALSPQTDRGGREREREGRR